MAFAVVGAHWLLPVLGAVGGYAARWTKEVFGKRYVIRAVSEQSDPRAPAPRNVVVLLPMQDAVSHGLQLHVLFGQSEELGGDLRAASQTLQQLGLSAVIHEGAMMGEKRPIVYSHLGRSYPMTKGQETPEPMAFVLEALGRALVAKEKRDPYKVACGRRLRRARIAVGYPVRQAFADDMREPHDNVRKWELGDHLVPPAFVTEMWKRWGITHDWIYRSDPSGVPKKYYDALLTEDPRLTEE